MGKRCFAEEAKVEMEEAIEQKRIEMHLAYVRYGRFSPRTLQLSEELDALLNHYHLIQLR